MALLTQQDDEVMSTINITPFTDVLLVLLIIFIILTSLTHEQRLPDAKNKTRLENSQIVVTIDSHDRVAIGAHSVTLAEMPEAFRKFAELTGHRYANVIIKADPHAKYGALIRVMDAAKAVNLTNFGLANHIEGTPQQ
jgi:biopolymer transport protein TolR